jgi:GR25 family glycosyltransferase involved in LPS biosynthesis
MRVIILNLTRRTDRRDTSHAEFVKHGFNDVEWLPSWDANDFFTTADVVKKTRSDPDAKVWFLDWFNEENPYRSPTEATALHNDELNQYTDKRWIAKVCCAESHRSAWGRIATGTDDWGLILEDDFKIVRPFSSLKTPADDCEYPCYSVGRSYWANKQGYNGLDGYIIHKRTAWMLLEQLDICRPNRPYWRTCMSLDNGFQQAVEQGLFAPKVDCPLITMVDSPSDIER